MDHFVHEPKFPFKGFDLFFGIGIEILLEEEIEIIHPQCIAPHRRDHLKGAEIFADLFGLEFFTRLREILKGYIGDSGKDIMGVCFEYIIKLMGTKRIFESIAVGARFRAIASLSGLPAPIGGSWAASPTMITVASRSILAINLAKRNE